MFLRGTDRRSGFSPLHAVRSDRQRGAAQDQHAAGGPSCLTGYDPVAIGYEVVGGP